MSADAFRYKGEVPERLFLERSDIMIKATGYATADAATPLTSFDFERREPGPKDVQIDILYCGVCHSDLHQARNEWGNTVYPCLPGHEIIGRVAQIGSEVTKYKVGDTVGVGCMVNSCQQCEACKLGLEQFCEGPNSFTATYNGPMKPDGTNTFGGYSNTIVVFEDFVLRVPESLDLQSAAPLLCAGVTTYSPLRHWNVAPGEKVGIVGIGGLGHMALQLAKAMGAEVTAFTTDPKKEADARRLGASDVVVSTDEKAMSQYEAKLNYILLTIPDAIDVNPYIKLLKRGGTLTIVGVLAPLEPGVNNMLLAGERRSVAGSLIGSIPETQEVLDFCAKHNITAEVEVIPIQEINTAYERMKKGDVKFRFVIDMASVK